MFTFSQLVDDMVSETKRPDLVSEIARYVNQTVRECHFSPDRNAAILYQENFHEELVTAAAESGETWEIPSPTQDSRLGRRRWGSGLPPSSGTEWAKETTPGRHLNDLDHFFYRVGGTFVFSGYGGIGSAIALGWYEFPQSLTYKSAAARPASYDPESGWTYADAVNTPELEAAARLVTTNWLLMRWSDVISEGVRAKIYKRLSDTERARTSYSMYGSLRQGLWTSETAELFGG